MNKKPIIGIVGKPQCDDVIWNKICISNEIKDAINKNGGVAIGIIPQSKIKQIKEGKPFSYQNYYLDEKSLSDLFSTIDLCDGIILEGGITICDYEQEIAKYLENVSNAHLSDETKAQIRAMMREIGELESVGDACYNMARVIKRKQNNKEHFTEMQKQHINGMTGLLDMALNQMVTVMKEGKGALNINRVINLENEINNYRDLLKNNNITDLNEHRYSYTLGSMYTDIINECERLGDYVVNVVEARIGK